VSLLNGASQVRRTAFSWSAAMVARKTSRLIRSSRERPSTGIASSFARVSAQYAARRDQASGVF
jgi:hypothetical protein